MCRYQRCPWTTTRGGAPAQLPWLSTLITFLILKTGLVLLFHHDLRREISHRGGARVMALWLSCVVLLMALCGTRVGSTIQKLLRTFTVYIYRWPSCTSPLHCSWLSAQRAIPVLMSMMGVRTGRKVVSARRSASLAFELGPNHFCAAKASSMCWFSCATSSGFMKTGCPVSCNSCPAPIDPKLTELGDEEVTLEIEGFGTIRPAKRVGGLSSHDPF